MGTDVTARDGILDALLWEDWPGLRRQVRTVCELDLDSGVLAETGIVSLLSDFSLDRHLGPVGPYGQAAVERWRSWVTNHPIRSRARTS